MPAIAALMVLAVVIGAGAFGDDDGPKVSADGSGADQTIDAGATSTTGTGTGSPEDTGYGVTGLTVPGSTLPAVGTETAMAPVNKSQLSRSLRKGTFGDDVTRLQDRLSALGFAPGVSDGAFGDMTQQAVWAFEKLVLRTPREQATGVVSNDMWLRMQDPIAIQPRRSVAGTHVEIYLPEQVAAVFTNDQATLVIHISSGTARTPDRTPGNSWCETFREDTDANGNTIDPPLEKPVCGVSYTPGGVFRFKREVVGDRVGALGRMFNPIYFNYGIAMHGAKEVPLQPASHGCIRMNRTISDTFTNFVNIGDRVYVWGEDGKEPEQYTRRESTPVFNYPDPSAVTTTTATPKPTTTSAKPVTTTSTKTSTATTVTPTTQKPAPTTTTSSTPAATTTTSPPPAPTTTAPVVTVPATTQPATTQPATTAAGGGGGGG